MSTKHIALPKPKFNKTVVYLLLALVLALIIHDPIGSADTVHHVIASVQTFSSSTGGGR